MEMERERETESQVGRVGGSEARVRAGEREGE